MPLRQNLPVISPQPDTKKTKNNGAVMPQNAPSCRRRRQWTNKWNCFKRAKQNAEGTQQQIEKMTTTTSEYLQTVSFKA